MFDRRQLLQKVDAGSAKEDAHLIGKAGAQALLAGAPRRFKVSRAYERVERSRSAPRASIILRANCRVVHKIYGMLKLQVIWWVGVFLSARCCLMSPFVL